MSLLKVNSIIHPSGASNNINLDVNGNINIGNSIYSTLYTANSQNTTSGSSIDFTGIPSWAKRITLLLSGVSTSGTSFPMVQLGSSSVANTGYVMTGGASTTSATGISTGTAGFILRTQALSTSIVYGSISFYLITGNTWVAGGTFTDTSDNRQMWTNGSVTLSGTLDRVRLTTVNGTDTFDAGVANIMYEG